MRPAHWGPFHLILGGKILRPSLRTGSANSARRVCTEAYIIFSFVGVWEELRRPAQGQEAGLLGRTSPAPEPPQRAA